MCAVADDLIAPGFVTVYTELSIQFLIQSFAFKPMNRGKKLTHTQSTVFFFCLYFDLQPKVKVYDYDNVFGNCSLSVCVYVNIESSSEEKKQQATEFHRLNCTIQREKLYRFWTNTLKQTRLLFFFQCPIWKITQLRLKCTNSKQWAQILRVFHGEKDS